jgi:hypothetical protein
MFCRIRLLQLTLVVFSFALVIRAEQLDTVERFTCSNATLHGTYGLHATGIVNGVGAFAAIGRFTFDGKGNLIGKVFFNQAGNPGETPEFEGTYSVTPDCFVNDDWGGGNNHISVIVDHGKGYFILNPSSDRSVSGEARRQ